MVEYGELAGAKILIQWRKSKGEWVQIQQAYAWKQLYYQKVNNHGKIYHNEIIEKIKEKCPGADRYKAQLIFKSKGFQKGTTTREIGLTYMEKNPVLQIPL